MPDIPELEIASDYASKTGWGLSSWLKQKARATDHKDIVVYVIGGVTFDEIKHIQDILAAFPKFNVIVGGTKITNSDTALIDLLSSQVMR